MRNQFRKQIRANGVDSAHLERRAQLILAGTGRLPNAFGGFQRALGGIDDLLAHRRQPDIRVTALKQGHTQFVFQLFHGNAKGGLTDETGFGGTPEMAFTRKRDDVLQICQRHFFLSIPVKE